MPKGRELAAAWPPFGWHPSHLGWHRTNRTRESLFARGHGACATWRQSRRFTAPESPGLPENLGGDVESCCKRTTAPENRLPGAGERDGLTQRNGGSAQDSSGERLERAVWRTGGTGPPDPSRLRTEARFPPMAGRYG